MSDSGGIGFNMNYLTSIPGILKVVEVVFGLICWALIASIGTWALSYSPAFQFVMFVAVTSWILTLVLLVMYLLALHTKCAGAPWTLVEFAFNAFWSLLYFIAACVAAAYCGNVSVLVGGTVFAWFVTVVYIAHTLVSYKEWKGGFPWEGSAASSSGPASSAKDPPAGAV